MTKSIPLSAFAAAAAVAIGFALTSAAPAKAASLAESCSGSTRSAVEKCCNTWVKRKGKPIWMIQANATCSTVVACSSAGKIKGDGIRAANLPPKKLCMIDIPGVTSTGGGPGTPPPVIRGNNGPG